MDELNEVSLSKLAYRVGHTLKEAGLMVAAAESCTGGLVGHLMTEIPGSSAWFAGSAGVYSYGAKERLLGVDHETLMREGAVSSAVAEQMARGARRLYEVDAAVSITGIAGPGGGSDGKPMGMVHLHLSARGGVERSECKVWESDRRGNKLLSARFALEMLLDHARNFTRSAS